MIDCISTQIRSFRSLARIGKQKHEFSELQVPIPNCVVYHSSRDTSNQLHLDPRNRLGISKPTMQSPRNVIEEHAAELRVGLWHHQNHDCRHRLNISGTRPKLIDPWQPPFPHPTSLPLNRPIPDKLLPWWSFGMWWPIWFKTKRESYFHTYVRYSSNAFMNASASDWLSREWARFRTIRSKQSIKQYHITKNKRWISESKWIQMKRHRSYRATHG